MTFFCLMLSEYSFSIKCEKKGNVFSKYDQKVKNKYYKTFKLTIKKKKNLKYFLLNFLYFRITLKQNKIQSSILNIFFFRVKFLYIIIL